MQMFIYAYILKKMSTYVLFIIIVIPSLIPSFLLHPELFIKALCIDSGDENYSLLLLEYYIIFEYKSKSTILTNILHPRFQVKLVLWNKFTCHEKQFLHNHNDIFG